MLEIVPDPFVDLEKGSLLHLYRSLNEPVISPGAGETAEPAQSFMMVLQWPSEMISIYLGLYFTRSERRVLYVLSSFQPRQLEEKLLNSESFAGEMGFLLENTRFHMASAEEKTELIRTVPFFYQDLSFYQKAMTPDEMAARDTQQMSRVPTQSASEDVYTRLLAML